MPGFFDLQREVMKMKRKGFTLIELLVVIVVIGILAAMMSLTASEFIASAKASNIIANLTTLKKATLAWYLDNLDKIVMTDQKNPTRYAGTVLIGDKSQPVQQWKDSEIHLSSYINNMGSTGINLNNTKTVKYADGTTKTNTNMAPGYYGICDAGNGKRTTWYVGYCFKEDEARVREKIIGRKDSVGIWLGTADAHENKNEDNSAAVWMLVVKMK